MSDKPRYFQPGLFDSPYVPPETGAETPTPKPVWTFHGLPELDYIGDETIHAFVYDISVLEQTSSYYGFEPTKQLLHALKSLGNSKRSKLRERAFTIFMGDAGYGYSMFIVGLASTNADLAAVIRPFMEAVDGFDTEEIGSSSSLMPVYRYDHGHVIRYSDMESAGNTELDDDKNFGTGLELFHRWYMPPEMDGLRGSHYGKLIKSS